MNVYLFSFINMYKTLLDLFSVQMKVVAYGGIKFWFLVDCFDFAQFQNQ